MFFYAVIIAVCTSGLVSGNENCFSLFPNEKLIEAGFIPDKEQLADLCPDIKSYMDCEELKVRIHEEEILVSYFYDIHKLIQDLCNRNSSLHKAYVSDVYCFKKEMQKWELCYQTGRDIYVDYREFVTDPEADEQEDDINFSEPHCLIGSYSAACVATYILENCGILPFEAFVEIIHRSHFLKEQCNEDAFHKLQTKFLDFLQREGTENLGVYRSIFDFRK